MPRRIYVIVGLDSLSAIDDIVAMAEELGVELHLVLSPRRLGGVIIEGMLVRSVDELPGKLAEAYALSFNIDGLVLACCG